MVDNFVEVRENFKEELKKACLTRSYEILKKMLKEFPILLLTLHDDFHIRDTLFKYDDPEVIKLFLQQHGENFIELFTFTYEQTLLHLATSRGTIKIVKCLINNNANVNVKDCAGNTALHNACNYSVSPKIVELLLRSEANVNSLNKSKQTPLHRLRCGTSVFDDTLKLLLLFNANMWIEDSSKKCAIDHFDENDLTKAEECLKELHKMKTIKLDTKHSLHDILFKNVNTLTKFVSNPILQNIFYGGKFNDFKHYGNMMKNRYRKGLSRKRLLNSATESLKFTLQNTLPTECCKMIVCYLHDREDLEKLVRKQRITRCSSMYPKGNMFLSSGMCVK